MNFVKTEKGYNVSNTTSYTMGTVLHKQEYCKIGEIGYDEYSKEYQFRQLDSIDSIDSIAFLRPVSMAKILSFLLDLNANCTDCQITTSTS